jgi:hypothetical protein
VVGKHWPSLSRSGPLNVAVALKHYPVFRYVQHGLPDSAEPVLSSLGARAVSSPCSHVLAVLPTHARKLRLSLRS